ncbi:MAG: Rne/Rng family ribonuclease [Fibrobacteria bacterium]|nr:Rne/Rng family ribonuclease [Fibrobacteria bacterium]
MAWNIQHKRQILINFTPYEKRIAILDSNHLAEVFYEYQEDSTLLGCIYKGVVNAVLPGLQAAFVDLGEEKAGFLHVEDVGDRMRHLRNEYDDDDDNGKSESHQIETIDKLLKVGQEVIVQVTKEPIGTKGPRLTMHITLPGRFLVCMPGTSFVGVSKKIRDMKRRRELKKIIHGLKGADVGYIVRTLGQKQSEEELRKQMEILESRWELCKTNANDREAPCMIYRDTGFSESTLRDYFTKNVDKVIIDDVQEYQAVVDYLNFLSPEMASRVSLHDEPQSLFDYFGLEEELEKTFESKVFLRRGGYLIIEQTEALVSIDVNTGSKVRGKNQAKNIVETNIDSAWEIAKQMRLRDLGGLIVIDFIDMESEEDIKSVENEFKKAIRQDKSPVHFSSITQFGLMELTRKRVRPNLTKNRSLICPTCQGNRYIPIIESVLASIDRWFRRFRLNSNIKDVTIILGTEMVDRILENRAKIVKYWERKYTINLEIMENERASFSDFLIFDSKTEEDLTPMHLTSYREDTVSTKNLDGDE